MGSYNSGDASAKIDGYTLGDGAKKKFSLAGYGIPPGSCLVLKKAQDKLTLKNTEGAVSLYSPSGHVMDAAGFAGLMFGVASFFLLFFIYVIQKNRNISKFFFGGDEEIGI
jgi:hypothetical protein